MKMWLAQPMANRWRRNNVGVDDIAQAIHRMVDAMQPIAAQPRVVVAPTRPMTMEDFEAQTLKIHWKNHPR